MKRVLQRPIIAIILLVMGLVIYPAFTVIYTSIAIYDQQQGWCSLLTDIVVGPPPHYEPNPGPGAPEVKQLAYHRWLVYRDIIDKRKAYGCS